MGYDAISEAVEESAAFIDTTTFELSAAIEDSIIGIAACRPADSAPLVNSKGLMLAITPDASEEDDVSARFCWGLVAFICIVKVAAVADMLPKLPGVSDDDGDGL